MATRDIIVIGASAGGVQALSTLVADLSPNLPAAVFIVLHVSANAPSLLPVILARECSLDVAQVSDGEPIQRGRVYVAPPDQHLIIEDGHARLVHGPKENLHRPSIDTLFRSAARWGGTRVIGVILTGARDDGKVGMRAVQQRGGLTIVQDPLEATFSSMPMSVLQDIRVDYSLPLREIAPLLNTLSCEVADEEGRFSVPDEVELESRIAEQKMESAELIASVEQLGRVSFEKRAREAEKHGEEALFKRDPRAKGYLRSQTGYRLFEQRDKLCELLTTDVRKNRDWLFESLEYPLAGGPKRG